MSSEDSNHKESQGSFSSLISGHSSDRSHLTFETRPPPFQHPRMPLHHQHSEAPTWSQGSHLQMGMSHYQNHPQQHPPPMMEHSQHQYEPKVGCPQKQHPPMMGNPSQLQPLPMRGKPSQLQPPSMMGNPSLHPPPMMGNPSQQHPPPMMGNQSQQHPPPMMSNPSRSQPPPMMGNPSQQQSASMMGNVSQLQPLPMMGNPSPLQPPPMMGNPSQQHHPSMMGNPSQQQPSPVMGNPSRLQPPSVMGNPSRLQPPPMMGNSFQLQPPPMMDNPSRQQSPPIMGHLQQPPHSVVGQPPPVRGNQPQQQPPPIMGHSSRQNCLSVSGHPLQAQPPPKTGHLQQQFPPMLGNSVQYQQPPTVMGNTENQHPQQHHIQPPIMGNTTQLHPAMNLLSQQPLQPVMKQPIRQQQNLPISCQSQEQKLPVAGILSTQQPLVMAVCVPSEGSEITSQELCTSIQTPTSSLQQQKIDQNWIDNWVKNLPYKLHLQNQYPKKLKISDVQLDVVNFQRLLSKLKNFQKKSSEICENASQREMEMLAFEIKNMGTELEILKKKLSDPQYCLSVKKLVEQRRKKRSRQRIGKKKMLEKEKIKKVIWRQSEEEIDQWQNLLVQKEENKQREKVVKEEADGILGEIRGKMQELQMMQQLLESLVTLRQDRCKKGQTHGYVDTRKGKHHFTVMIDKLREILKQQQIKYELEEQTLCVMMEESTCSARPQALLQSISSTASQKQKEITKCLFGDFHIPDVATCASFTAADWSLEILIQRRFKWDQFVTSEERPLASNVPLGWVIPPEHPNMSWKSFQIQKE